MAFFNLHPASVTLLIMVSCCLLMDLAASEAPPCVDKKAHCEDWFFDDHKPICQFHKEWAADNCAKYCNFCGPPTPKPPCEDKLKNCLNYFFDDGLDLCTHHVTWSMTNCQKSCKLCSGIPTTPTPPYCRDEANNCNDYDSSVCTQYKPWATQNCRKTCKFCVASTTKAPPAPTKAPPAPTKAPPAPTMAPPAPTKAPPAPCVNKLANCGDYAKSVCTEFKPWAGDNCNRYCGFCTAPPCVDKKEHCQNWFFEDHKPICQYHKEWASEYCPKYCKFCGK